jgi:hypothetical protein
LVYAGATSCSTKYVENIWRQARMCKSAVGVSTPSRSKRAASNGLQSMSPTVTPRDDFCGSDPPAAAGAVVPDSHLNRPRVEQEGATVEWERPLEQRGMAEMAQEVIVNMVAAGNLVAIKVAVDKFRKHMRDRATATIEDDEEPGDG